MFHVEQWGDLWLDVPRGTEKLGRVDDYAAWRCCRR